MAESLGFLTYGITSISLVAFTACFRASYYISDRFLPAFRSFSTTERANWCSRIGSTLHATVICIGITYSIFQQEWDANLLPLHSIDLAHGLFSWSIAYFTYDLVVVVYWKLPSWKVFVAHHLIAMTPFCIFNFYRVKCLSDTYLLSLYLLVELCVIPMNIVAFLDDIGQRNSFAHVLFSYLSFGTWIVARGFLPIYALYILWTVMVPSLDIHAPGTWICVGPAILCGHIISGFCVGCLIFIITPEFLARWKQPKEEEEQKLVESPSTTYGALNSA